MESLQKPALASADAEQLASLFQYFLGYKVRMSRSIVRGPHFISLFLPSSNSIFKHKSSNSIGT